ncbi:MAG TPA: glycosyltransferase [Candidatus Limnocylindria bacterium]|nr:glycosyltransferase [Candidatus Limnocylindria bacterium]
MREGAERRLLVIAYFFPPVGGVGVERTLKHVTYLPELGWRPVVVAPSNSAYRVVDPRLLARVPAGTEVMRTPTAEPGHLRAILGAVRRTARRGPRTPAESRVGPEGPARDEVLAERPTRPPGAVRRLANAGWARAVPALFFPDEQLLWAPSAVLAGWRAGRRRRVSAIYSSSPPVSGHLAAALLKRLLRAPWVADFRDPWIGNAFARRLSAPHRALQASLERRIVTGADRVVLPTEAIRDEYAARYPRQRGRLVTIPNGYDLAELGGGSPHAPAGGALEDGERTAGARPFRLIYAGSLYGEHELDLLLDGVERLLARDAGWRDRLCIELVGYLSERNRAVARRRLEALSPVVSILGFRAREEAIERQRAADAALVLLAAGRSGVATSKLYEYLGLDLPILAVAPPGEARRILADLGWGVGADPTPEGVADGLERIVAWRRPRAIADPERRYERRALSVRLAALLEELAPAAPG